MKIWFYTHFNNSLSATMHKNKINCKIFNYWINNYYLIVRQVYNAENIFNFFIYKMLKMIKHMHIINKITHSLFYVNRILNVQMYLVSVQYICIYVYQLKPQKYVFTEHKNLVGDK